GSLSRYSKSTVRRHRRVSHFEVEFALYFGLRGMAYGPNIGNISQVVTITDGKGFITLTGEEGNCEISIKFSDKDNGILKVDTNPDKNECGFGHNVYAYGDFIRVSDKPTPFDIGY
ncbi:hypothetical protein ACLHZU_19720, partial [Aeromonas salmonicida]|uniref:hypothetical protein n=1 Tax=Aeromonas salmonicida TaxID=645 RepID=UPI003D07F5CF